MKTTVVAVIGCGRIADSAHFPALSQLENARIKYACDLIPEKAEAMKAKYPKVEQVITDYKIALADPEVEVVYVLTPNFAHYTITMAALKAGKHVFCEKPIAVHYDLAVEMADEAARQGKLLNIGVCNRYHNSVEKIEEMVRTGKLGKVYHVYCSFRSFRSIPGLGGPFTDRSQSGGGVLIDWGVHFFDLILYILGNPALKTLTCDTYNEMAKDMKTYRYKSMWAENTANIESGVNDVDDFVTGYIRTAGPSISFNGAWAQNLDQKDMYIDFLGDRGGVRLDYGKHFVYCDGQTLESETPEFEIPNMYLCEDRDFLRAIATGEKTRNHITNVLGSARLLEGLYESAAKHCEIAVKD